MTVQKCLHERQQAKPHFMILKKTETHGVPD